MHAYFCFSGNVIYFDNNATTQIDPRVLEAMLPFLGQFYGNPSSLYRAGRVARSAVETAREQVAALVAAQPMQVIFTSGGTEANNLALRSQAKQTGIAISSIEHPSILEAATALQHSGKTVTVIPVESDGKVAEMVLDGFAKKDIGFVSIMLANNETGVLQDVSQYASNCRQQNIVIHTDAVQAIGKIAVNFEQLGVHLMTLSSHKIYGPKGCGALIVEPQLNLSPMIIGGEQEHDLRAGTENVAAIVGFGKAAELAKAELDHRQQHLLALRMLLEQELKRIPGLVVFAENQRRLPNTVQFGLSDSDGEMLLMQLDKQGVAVSSGSACKSGGGKPSHVLLAMGVETFMAKSAIRVSLGKHNTLAEIEQFIKVLKSII